MMCIDLLFTGGGGEGGIVFIRTLHPTWNYVLNKRTPKQILFLSRCAYHIKPHLWGFFQGEVAPWVYPTTAFLLNSGLAFEQFLNGEITEMCDHFHLKYIFSQIFPLIQKSLENCN